jgi:hypothetical protein
LSTTQFDASDLAHILLDGTIGALTARGDLTAEQKQTRARGLWAVVANCEPRDAIQTMLVGQCLMFNEMIADAGRDVLVGMMDTLKSRAQSNLNGLSRALQQSIAMLVRLRDKSAAAVAVTQESLSELDAAAERRLDAIRKPPSPKAEAETPRRGDPVQPLENIPSKALGIDQTARPGTGAVNGASTVADGMRFATGTTAPRPNPAIDPRPEKPIARPTVEPMPPRPNGAHIPELT